LKSAPARRRTSGQRSGLPSLRRTPGLHVGLAAIDRIAWTPLVAFAERRATQLVIGQLDPPAVARAIDRATTCQGLLRWCSADRKTSNRRHLSLRSSMDHGLLRALVWRQVGGLSWVGGRGWCGEGQGKDGTPAVIVGYAPNDALPQARVEPTARAANSCPGRRQRSTAAGSGQAYTRPGETCTPAGVGGSAGQEYQPFADEVEPGHRHVGAVDHKLVGGAEATETVARGRHLLGHIGR